MEELPDFDEEEQKDEKDKAMGKHTLSIDILGLSGKGYPQFFHGLSPSFPIKIIKMAILRQTHLLLVLSFALRPCWKKVPGEWRCQESEPSRNACARDAQWGPGDVRKGLESPKVEMGFLVWVFSRHLDDVLVNQMFVHGHWSVKTSRKTHKNIVWVWRCGRPRLHLAS